MLDPTHPPKTAHCSKIVHLRTTQNTMKSHDETLHSTTLSDGYWRLPRFGLENSRRLVACGRFGWYGRFGFSPLLPQTRKPCVKCFHPPCSAHLSLPLVETDRANRTRSSLFGVSGRGHTLSLQSRSLSVLVSRYRPLVRMRADAQGKRLTDLRRKRTPNATKLATSVCAPA